MSETKMSEIIKASLEGVRSFTDADTAIGKVISTPSGVTVIPVSKVSVGVATGGIDYGTHKSTSTENFGGGGGTGVSVTPIAFLTVGRDGAVELIKLSSSKTDVDRISSLIESAPDIIERVKEIFT